MDFIWIGNCFIAFFILTIELNVISLAILIICVINLCIMKLKCHWNVNIIANLSSNIKYSNKNIFFLYYGNIVVENNNIIFKFEIKKILLLRTTIWFLSFRFFFIFFFFNDYSKEWFSNLKICDDIVVIAITAIWFSNLMIDLVNR